mgnify:CR=1 FL=1
MTPISRTARVGWIFQAAWAESCPMRAASGHGNGLSGDADLSRAEHRQRRRHHLHETVLQNAVRDAVLATGMNKRESWQPLAAAFVCTHSLEAGYDIRTIQELLGTWSTRMSSTAAGSACKAHSIGSPWDVECLGGHQKQVGRGPTRRRAKGAF